MLSAGLILAGGVIGGAISGGLKGALWGPAGAGLGAIVVGAIRGGWKGLVTFGAGALGQSYGFTWGGTWASPKTDNPHFEMFWH